ncbi:hypothetical protein BJY00DRAFT_322735 [Aspergillus carlsbadensis]|nr:hypothetical protein BJY00DRAFT_322735 [Aspergillus carlsbadensis]
MGHRRPYGGTKVLWGKVPAIDMLQLKDNEGEVNSQDFTLLLASSGDLRNLVKTINSLPETYSGSCVIMVHLWYSAFLPKDLLQAVQSKIVPPLQELLNLTQEEPTKLLKKTFSNHNVTLTATLSRSAWEKILSNFKCSSSVSFSEASALRRSVTMAEHRQDYVDRALFRLPPPWRLAHMRFREDGVLLPFGAARDQFNTPNPTLFQDTELWPMADYADPLDGWTLGEILQTSYGAENDIYGQLHQHVIGFLRKFCEKLPALKLNISLLNMDAGSLPKCIDMFDGKQQAYDRIDLASVAETGPQLAEALDSFGPLLKSKKQNPKATLLTMFPDITLKMRTFADQKDWLSRKTAIADYLNFLSAHDLFLNRNAIFNRFIKSACLTQIGARVDLEMKLKHTVIAKWPLRLPKSPTKHDFEMLHWSSHHGSERYIEWQRAF